ncbi:hypothetical protein ACQP3J_26565, partial [Escherichia coli]
LLKIFRKFSEASQAAMLVKDKHGHSRFSLEHQRHAVVHMLSQHVLYTHTHIGNRKLFNYVYCHPIHNNKKTNEP